MSFIQEHCKGPRLIAVHGLYPEVSDGEIEGSPQEILDTPRQARIRHSSGLDSCFLQEGGHYRMRHGNSASGVVLYPGIRPRVLDKFIQILPRRILPNHEGKGHEANVADGLEVPIGVANIGPIQDDENQRGHPSIEKQIPVARL